MKAVYVLGGVGHDFVKIGVSWNPTSKITDNKR